MSSGSSGDDGWGTGGRKKINEAELDITPMIDVTFLLLIFFMVSSTMQPTPDLTVPAANNGEAVETKDAVLFLISGSEAAGQTPVISLSSGEQVTLDGVRQEVRDAIAQGKRKAVIRADGQTSAGFVRDVQKAIRETGVELQQQISFDVGVREKKQ